MQTFLCFAFYVCYKMKYNSFEIFEAVNYFDMLMHYFPVLLKNGMKLNKTIQLNKSYSQILFNWNYRGPIPKGPVLRFCGDK